MLDFLKLKYNFTHYFFSEKIIPPVYSNVYNTIIGQDYPNEQTAPREELKNQVFVINIIPPYFDLKVNTSALKYGIFKMNHLNGFLANLEGSNTIDDYLKQQFGAKSRSKIRGYIRRLETCFDIRYKMFFGTITKAEYEFLFDRLHLMITRRFAQRGQTHLSLSNWEHLKQSTFSKIQDKKASLFVIYDGDKPIDICLNYHHQNIILDAVRSYDIDYSKFRVGHIDILKQLEWCFTNDYSIFDLSYGDLDYKRKWCNVAYEFEQHVLFPKNSKVKMAKAYIVFQLLKLKEYLKAKGVDVLYKKSKFIIKKGQRNPMGNEQNGQFNRVDGLSESALPTYKIDINEEAYAFLRKPVYDFQYLNFESSDTIGVYKVDNQDNIFIISGTNCGESISIKHFGN